MEWRSLEDFPDYQFSDTGLVKKKGKYHKLFLNDGYPSVVVSNKFIRKQVRVHRVVAELFIGSCPEGQLVRHLDDDRENNNLSNLAYGTCKDNMQDAVRNGKMAKGDKHFSKTNPEKVLKREKHGRAKLTQKEVNEIKETEYYHGCNVYLAKKFNISHTTIWRIRNNYTWNT